MDYKNYNPRQAALTEARGPADRCRQGRRGRWHPCPPRNCPDFIVEIPADVKNGDVASNIAMAGARAFHKAPRQIAEAITAKLDLNGTLFSGATLQAPASSTCSWVRIGSPALSAPPAPTRNTAAPTPVPGKKYNVEFVSRQPHRPHAHG